MENNFFDLVKPNFFSVFNGKYKEINYAILTLINDHMKKENGQLRKEVIVDLISDFFKTNPNLVKDSNDEFTLYKKNPAELVRNYADCGWLVSETTIDFVVYYQLDPVGIQVLSAMNEAVINDTKPIEYSGYIYSMNKLTENFNLDEATSITEQLLNNKREFEKSLSMVNSRIKKFLNNLMNSKDKNPKEILEELLLKYQNNVVAKVFNNLRGKDNPNKYKDEIITNLYSVLENNKVELINNYIDTKLNGDYSIKNRTIAEQYFEDSFNEIILMFDNINDRISVLDNRNAQYVQSSKARLSFLLNDKENIEGKIDKALKKIEDLNEKEDIDFELDNFDIFQLGHIDDTSLYSRSKAFKVGDSTTSVKKTFLTPEEKQKIIDQVKHDMMFSCYEVNNFILEKLGNNETIMASDIKLKSFDEFIVMFLALLYSEESFVNYRVDIFDSYFTYENKSINNFRIWRKR